MKYFTEDELKCSHCGSQGMKEDFMVKVEQLREELGFPFPVTSAYRCNNHPIEAKKDLPGAHASGRAIDIAVSRTEAYLLVEAALRAGFTGIGINQKGSSRFIHLDDLTTGVRPTVWSY
jgi:zinc D-Ala-D-Ala carboxypeptidase